MEVPNVEQLLDYVFTPEDFNDSLSTQDAIKAVKELRTAHDVRVILRYEETHKNRTSVVNATQTQVATLAKEAVGVDS